MQIYSIFPKNKNLPSIKSDKCTNLNSFWIINSLFFEKNRTLANIIIHRINMRRFLIYMYTLSSLMICCITLSSCKDKSIKNTLPKNDTDSVQCTNESTHLQDSTIYGISDEFGMSTHIGTYGSGYLIQWARTIPNTRSMLLELPQVNNHNAIINNDYAGKFCRATIRLLESI